MKTNTNTYLTRHGGSVSTDVADAMVFDSSGDAIAGAGNILLGPDDRIVIEPVRQGHIVILSKKVKCVCKLGPGHNMPNRETYVLDHRCFAHGEKTLPQVWGRHKELEMPIDVEVYNALVEDTSGAHKKWLYVGLSGELTPHENGAKIYERYIEAEVAAKNAIDLVPTHDHAHYHGFLMRIRPYAKGYASGFTVSYVTGEQE